jgi:hypothetical protein
LVSGHRVWSLILREEHRLSEFDNRVLRRIFDPKRDEVTGGWRKLYNECVLVFFSKYNQNVQVKYNEIYRTCSTIANEDVGRKSRTKETNMKNRAYAE